MCVCWGQGEIFSHCWLGVWSKLIAYQESKSCVIMCVFIRGFVCTSVSLHGLIAHQRTAQVPVSCLTTFESVLTQLPDFLGWLVRSGGRWVLPVPNVSHCSLGHLQCCTAVSESFHRSGDLKRLFLTLWELLERPTSLHIIRWTSVKV